MRNDFKKVLVECYRINRYGPSPSNRLRRQKPKIDEDGNLIESQFHARKYGIKRRTNYREERKSFGENLKPLYRYLGKQVGRPWDKVYSEIHKACSADSTVGAHIYQHLFDMVVLHVEIKMVGKKKAPFRTTGRELYAYPSSWYHAFYQDPNGFLRRSPILAPQTHLSNLDYRYVDKKLQISRAKPFTDTQEWFEIKTVPGFYLGSWWTSKWLKRKGFDPELVGIVHRYMQGQPEDLRPILSLIKP